jgi:hypothetical protein
MRERIAFIEGLNVLALPSAVLLAKSPVNTRALVLFFKTPRSHEGNRFAWYAPSLRELPDHSEVTASFGSTV